MEEVSLNFLQRILQLFFLFVPSHRESLFGFAVDPRPPDALGASPIFGATPEALRASQDNLCPRSAFFGFPNDLSRCQYFQLH